MRSTPSGSLLPSDDRHSYVLFEDNACTLLLITKPGSEAEEQERTELPAQHGQFLLEVCTGTLVCYRVSLAIGDGREALVSSFSIPGSLHLIEVSFEGQQQAGQFVPPLWFGPEITDDVTFEHNAMATRGMPEQALMPITDASIHAVLDLFDDIVRSRWSPLRGEVEPLRAVQRAKASGCQ